MKYSPWAYRITNKSACTIIQEIATSSPYRYKKEGLESCDTGFFVFYPDTKKVKHLYDSYTLFNEYPNCQVVYTTEDVVKLLNNPPIEEENIISSTDSGKGAIKIDDTGAVTFYKTGGKVKIAAELFEEIIASRKKITNVVQKFPLITFEYNIEKKKPEEKFHIAVLNEDTKLITGYDVNDGNMYKEFFKKDIIGDMIFIGFCDILPAKIEAENFDEIRKNGALHGI